VPHPNRHSRMGMLRRPALGEIFLSFLASAIVTVAVSFLGPLALLSSASALAVKPSLTLSFDARPAYSEWRGIQPGYRCVNGSVDRSAPSKPPSATFMRDGSPGNVRHGKVLSTSRAEPRRPRVLYLRGRGRYGVHGSQ
jgi:hypothetical protein